MGQGDIMSINAHRRGALVTAGFLCALLLGVMAANASAATYYVSNSAPIVANGKSCAQPNFNSVQAAITAGGSGVKVNVCPGTYTEQIQITNPAKLESVGGTGTATLKMPASPSLSSTACDTMGGLEQIDEVSICGASVIVNNLNIEAIIPLETCEKELYGIFIGGGGTLKATGDDVIGASTSLEAFKGCQHGVAIEVGSKTPAEVGTASLKNVTVTGYQKNGPTAKGVGSTLTMSGSTIKGEGPSPFIAQNGVEVAFGAKAKIKSSTVSGNECNVASCGANGEQASGMLFFEAASGTSVTGSTITENDLGVYYASGSKTVPASPDLVISKDVMTSNRYEGVYLEEGKALLKSDVINGSGLIGIDLAQFEYNESASASSASGTKVEGQTQAAIKVESDKGAGDFPGKFTFSHGTFSGNATILINESSTFEVVF
jgi:hypothetical protein